MLALATSACTNVPSTLRNRIGQQLNSPTFMFKGMSLMGNDIGLDPARFLVFVLSPPLYRF